MLSMVGIIIMLIMLVIHIVRLYTCIIIVVLKSFSIVTLDIWIRPSWICNSMATRQNLTLWYLKKMRFLRKYISDIILYKVSMAFTIIELYGNSLICMVHSYLCLQVVHWLFNVISKLIRGIKSIEMFHNINEIKSVQ